MIFRLGYTTVAVLFGVVALCSATNEALVSAVSTPGWRIVHLPMALLFAVVGIVAFIDPGDTFVALAALVSFYLIFRRTLDRIVAFSMSVAVRRWRLLMLTGRGNRARSSGMRFTCATVSELDEWFYVEKPCPAPLTR